MFKRKLLCSATTLLLSGVVHAESSHFDRLPIQLIGPLSHAQQDLGWRMGLGIGVESESEYAGSKNTATEADLYFEAGYRTERLDFRSGIVDNRLFYQLTPNIYTVTWVNFEEGREESEFDSLSGLGDIDDSIEIGGGVSWLASDNFGFTFAAQTYTSGSPDKGAVFFLATHYRLFESDNLRLDAIADISYGNADHLQTEFGITEAQSANSVYDEYKIDSGVKSYGLGLASVYQYSDNIYVAGSVSFEKYGSDVSDSPLVKAGSDTEEEISLGVIYRFF